jgi:protein-S-isoprenylcysteine O-methyltransferase Ste14
MSMNTSRTSQIYGGAQSALLVLFAAGYFFDSADPLFRSRVAAGIGLALSAAGLLLMFAALSSLREVVQVAPEPRAGGYLVTRGVYSRFRHPIYTAILILVVGLFLRKPTILIALAGMLVFVFLMIKVRVEERLLVVRYPEYVEYRRRAWGIVPWPGSRR